MALVIQEPDALAAWKRGCDLISQSGETFNLITVVGNPTTFEVDWLRQFNPKTINPAAQSLSDVAGTIFPYRLMGRGYARAELYGRYLALHQRARKMHRKTRKSWGTYFQRMISFGDKQVNQLDEAIVGIRSWTRNHKAATVIHISSAETDSIRKHTGNPCLQFIELLCPDAKTISLLAVYRNHDYFEKVLGNFIGLGQLLGFICNETGRAPGTLVCHSAHAYAESSGAKLRALAGL